MKLFCRVILVLFALIYIFSSSKALMKDVTRKRYAMHSALGSDRYCYGDLYGLSYLSDFKSQQDRENTGETDLAGLKSGNGCKMGDSLKRDIDVYSICDSYLFLFVKDSHEFCRADKYCYKRSIDWGHLNIHLDKRKINVLLIERTERSVREALKDTDLARSIIPSDREDLVLNSNQGLTYFRLNSDINDNLAFNLFDYRALSPIREFKAWMNYKLFGRVDPMVRVSGDGRRLYYGETMDTSKYTSSLVPLNRGDIDTCVSNLNKLYAHYKAAGFDYVYFCAIPNPCTLLEAKHIHYNNFIPMLEADPALKMPVIDMYSVLNKNADAYYSRFDTHWSRAGYRRWLEQFNNILDTIPKK